MSNREMNHARARVKARKRRDKKRRRRISRLSLFLFVLLCLFLAFFVNRSSAPEKNEGETIVLKVKDVDVIKGEEKPVFSAEATCTGDTSKVLDEDSNYTVASLVDELNRGIGYTLECSEDGKREGVYAIKAELTSEITTPLYAEWFGKVSINIEDGKFTVKNPYGEWDGEKFKLWEGGYAKNEFISYREKTYYLNEKEEKVTGWQEIEGGRYYFDKRGIMQTGWIEQEENTYYMDENGAMHLGWLSLGEERYYFDTEGKLVTGEMKLGAATYTFDEKGVLVSSEGAVDPEKPMVALTFDDGPGPKTMELLGYLEEHSARATFFMLGQNVPRYESAVKKMAEIGCELGNHTYDHKDLTKLSVEEMKKQIQDTNQAVANAAGQNVTVMRPPYGSVNDKVEATVNLPMILWSIDTLDWETRDAKKTIKNVMDNVQDGDVILMHDIHAETIEAAKELIPKLQEKGYQLVTVSELAQARGVTLSTGKRYGRFRK